MDFQGPGHSQATGQLLQHPKGFDKLLFVCETYFVVLNVYFKNLSYTNYSKFT